MREHVVQGSRFTDKCQLFQFIVAPRQYSKLPMHRHGAGPLLSANVTSIKIVYTTSIVVEWLENHSPTRRWRCATRVDQSSCSAPGRGWNGQLQPLWPRGGSSQVPGHLPRLLVFLVYFVWESLKGPTPQPWWAGWTPWQKERENLKGHVITPGGEGMLGNYQQNSRILILYIYFLSNIYN